MHPIIDFTTGGIHFYFNVEKPYTKISDYSGVGKSFLCESLKSALNTCEDTGVYPVIDLNFQTPIPTFILNGTQNDNMLKLNMNNSLIIIDEADDLLNTNHQIIDDIISNNTNYYVFMLRSVIPELSFDYTEKAYLVRENKSIEVKYYT